MPMLLYAMIRSFEQYYIAFSSNKGSVHVPIRLMLYKAIAIVIASFASSLRRYIHD